MTEIDWRARAEAAEAQRDAANALGAETTVQLKSAQYHLGVMVKAWEAAESRIAAALALYADKTWMVNALSAAMAAALAEPVEPQPREHTPSTLTDEARCLACRLPWPCPDGVGEPQPSACATCGGEKWVDDPTWALADELPPYVPCPSCTPPDPVP